MIEADYLSTEDIAEDQTGTVVQLRELEILAAQLVGLRFAGFER